MPYSLKTGDWYHYRTLPEYEKVIYMEIYRGIKAQRHPLRFPVAAHNGVYPTADRLLQIMLHVVWDNPKLYYFDATNVSYTYHRQQGAMLCELMFTDYFSDEATPMIEQTLVMRTEEILRGGEGCKSDYDLLWYFHSTLAKNVKYMHSIQKTNTLKNLEARTVTGPLLSHLGVCSGYAKTFKLLCDQVGIGCFYIGGQALADGQWANHGWNAVYLEGQFYHVDVTFDSSRYHNTGRLDAAHFLRGDRFMERNHRWDRLHFPAMPDDRPNG